MMNELCHLTNLSDLLELRELYRTEWPKHCHGHHTLDNFIKWLQAAPNLKNLHVYTFASSWRSTGLFLIVDRYHLFVNSLKPDDIELGAAMKLLDWTRGYKITSIPKSQHATVVDTLKQLGIAWRGVRLRIGQLPRTMALALKIECPPDFELRSLVAADAETINEVWPSRQAGSLHFIERLIAANISVGLIARETNELVAWCTRCQSGLLGTLQVKAAFRRRGLAKLIIREFAQRVAATDEDVRAAVYELNHASNSLFRQMGFQFDEFEEEIFHMNAFCVPNGLEWPEAED